MRIACYYAAAPGTHPNATPELYDRIWPIMQDSLLEHGYELDHLTDLEDKARGHRCFRFDVDPATVMFSREIAWLRYLERLPPGETAVMVEPDCLLRKPIPELTDGAFLMLRRPGASPPSGFRMATREAIPFYEAMVRHYNGLSREEQVFHGDVRCLRELLGIKPRGAGDMPRMWRGIPIEVRNASDYTTHGTPDAVAWNFKGSSKPRMLHHNRA